VAFQPISQKQAYCLFSGTQLYYARHELAYIICLLILGAVAPDMT